MSTNIEWTDETWNPIVGCSKVSPGCDNCYAVGTVHRGLAEQHRGLTVRAEGATDWTGEVRVVESMMDRPLRWTKPRRIFVNSLSDLFHPDRYAFRADHLRRTPAAVRWISAEPLLGPLPSLDLTGID